MDLDVNITWYISGPMTGIADFNYPYFAHVQKVVESMWNVNTRSPHMHNVPDGSHYSAYLKAAVRTMLDCDGIIMLPGWTKSRGARAELDLALDLEYPAMYFFEQFDIPQLVPMDDHALRSKVHSWGS